MVSMRFCRKPTIWIFLTLVRLTIMRAEENRSALSAEIPPSPTPLPIVLAFADTHQIPLSGVQAPSDRRAAPGDLAALLITLFNGKEQKQWLVELEAAALTDQERAVKAPPNWVLFVSTGTRVEFKHTPLALQLRIHGPFREKTSPKNVASKATRILVNADHLALGFDIACQTLLQIIEHRKTHASLPFNLSFGGAPFPPEVVEKTKAQAEEIGLKPEDERAFAGSGPALISFFDIAQKTPGLREIMWEIIDLPSAWSVVKKGGRVDPYFDFDGHHLAALATLPNQPARYMLPVTLLLNRQPGLKIRFIVTSPRPPLLTTAGILTLYADHPTKPEKHAVIQVLGTRSGARAE